MKRLLAWGLLVLAVAGAAGWWAWTTGRLDRWRGIEASPGVERAAAGRGGQQGRIGPGGRRGGGTFDPNQAIPVQAALARAGDIDVVINALGTVTARNTVTVRSRVEGQLVRIAFREGQYVKAGDLLAEVDPRPFQAQLDQARGQLARDQALLANAELDVERYRTLLAKDSIARQQVDAQEALVRQYRGAVQADQAAVDTARLQLAYARITAPISGLLGLRQVDVGNVIRASDVNGIVVITETQPITTVFSVPSDNIAAIQGRLMAQETLQVDLFGRDGMKQLANGRLISIDNQIDATTGTVKLKALFANKDGALFPNQFVNVRLRVESRRNVTLIPVAAIQRGSRGTFVYLVQDGAVSIRPVVLGPVSGDNVAIESGLAPGDQAVTDGADKLRQGAKVEVVVPDAPRGPREAGAGNRRRRGEAGTGAGGGAAAGPGGPGGAAGAPAAAGAPGSAAPQGAGGPGSGPVAPPPSSPPGAAAAPAVPLPGSAVPSSPAGVMPPPPATGTPPGGQSPGAATSGAAPPAERRSGP